MALGGYSTEKRFGRNELQSEHAAPGAFFCQTALNPKQKHRPLENTPQLVLTAPLIPKTNKPQNRNSRYSICSGGGYSTEKRFGRNELQSEHAAPGAFFCQTALNPKQKQYPPEITI
jgi:hypothetical protein